MGHNEKPTTNAFPWKEFFGFLGAVLVAYIGYIGIRSQIDIPMHATQTAAGMLAVSTVPTSVLSSPVQSTATVFSVPPTPSATETLLPTSTPTQISDTPAPTPVILFSDSFDNNGNYWPEVRRDTGIAKFKSDVSDGKLQLDIVYLGKGYRWVTVPAFRAENFYLSVNAEVVQFTDSSVIGVVILFRISNVGKSAYAIEFKNDRTFGLYSSKTLTGDGLWGLVHEENSDAFQLTERTVNNFAVRVLGQEFTAYANGIELFTFEDNDIQGTGSVGLGFSGEAGKSAIVTFDNLLITK